jgi:hypothetical protein
MLFEEFEKWCNNPSNFSVLADECSEDNFSIFFQSFYYGKSFFEVLADLGWQIHQLQACVEGILEDI